LCDLRDPRSAFEIGLRYKFAPIHQRGTRHLALWLSMQLRYNAQQRL
jgi:hypothetical protein